ncbi:MAG TPA: hypothetical protein VF755_01755 [Catenuloplanes sp.]|jgi:hypothetical protein
MSTMTAPPAELVEVTAMLCQRSGRGRGCTRLRWHQCRTCGWNGKPWDNDQPPLTDLAHGCDPDAVHRRADLVGGG